jgi:hypothetical protein
MSTVPLASRCGTQDQFSALLRLLVVPLTVIIMMTAAIALLVTAATMTPLPLPGAIVSAPRSSPSATTAIDDGGTALIQRQRIALPPAPLVVGLARLTYRPGANASNLAMPGPYLLVVESGVVATHLESAGTLVRAAKTSQAVAGDAFLHVGDCLLVPASTPASFTSAGGAPAMVIAAGVFPASLANIGLARSSTSSGQMVTTRWNSDWSPGAAVEPLAGGWAIDLTATPATIGLERVNLRPGAQISLPAQEVQALAVETGALTLGSDYGLVWLQHADGIDNWLNPGAMAVLLPAEGALLQSGASATLRNDGSGPLQILILTVAPSDAA